MESETKRVMKVLFVASVYRHLVSFHIPYMQYFQKKGYEVYAIGNGDEDRAILEQHNITCIDISFSRKPFSLDNLKAYKDLQQLFKAQSFELVHVHTPVAAFLTRAAYKQYKSGPIIYTAHGFHFFKGASVVNWLLYYPLEKLAAKWTDHLITMNEEDFVSAQKLLPKEKVSVVHGVGVEFSNASYDLKKLTRELNIAPNTVIISYVAELNANKNQMYLLENWHEIKKRNSNAMLLIIGTGQLEKQYQQYVKNEQLQDTLFLGYRQDVATLLKISDIVALLSYREGLPKSTMEAMDMGLPNIVTNTRGLRDLIQHQKNGFIIPLNNGEVLIETFTKLIQDEFLRKSMGQCSKELVKPYLLKNVLPEYEAIYERLVRK